MIITVNCSGCMAEVTIIHGQYVVVNADQADLHYDGDLLTWDCPSCGHADSYWPTFHHRDEWKEYRNG